MKLYLVMKAVSSMDIAGQSCNLSEGEYVIPAFADLKRPKNTQTVASLIFTLWRRKNDK